MYFVSRRLLHEENPRIALNGLFWLKVAMARVWPTVVVIWLATLATIAVAGVLVMSWLGEMMCDYEPLGGSASPNGEYAFDVTFRDCGRDLGFYYLISLRRTAMQQAEGRAPREIIVATYFNDLDLYPYWEDERLIVPYVHREPEVLRSSWRDVVVVIRRETDPRIDQAQ